MLTRNANFVSKLFLTVLTARQLTTAISAILGIMSLTTISHASFAPHRFNIAWSVLLQLNVVNALTGQGSLEVLRGVKSVQT